MKQQPCGRRFENFPKSAIAGALLFNLLVQNASPAFAAPTPIPQWVLSCQRPYNNMLKNIGRRFLTCIGISEPTDQEVSCLVSFVHISVSGDPGSTVRSYTVDDWERLTDCLEFWRDVSQLNADAVGDVPLPVHFQAAVPCAYTAVTDQIYAFTVYNQCRSSYGVGYAVEPDDSVDLDDDDDSVNGD